MKYCVDVLAAVQYPKVVFKNVPTTIGLGNFSVEFGDDLEFTKKSIAKGYTLFKKQMLWDNGHNYGDKHIPLLKELAAQYEELVNVNPQIRLILSPFCEHNLKNPDKYLDIVQSIAPHCQMLNTPWKGAFSQKYKNEVHGEKAHYTETISSFSYDGSDCIDEDIGRMQKEMRDSQEFYYWRPRFNLHKDMNDKQRKSPPDDIYMKQVVALCQDKGETHLPPHTTWKPVSEKNKPVLIYPKKIDKIVLKRYGQRIAKLNYYGTYTDGRYRYYSDKQGYQIGKVDVFVGGNKIGNINAPFRDGDFR